MFENVLAEQNAHWMGVLYEKAENREVRALIQAAKELKLTEGTLITADIEKEWLVDGIVIRAWPLYKFVALKA